MDVGLLLAALLGAVLLHSNSLAGAQQSQCPPLLDITNGFVTYAPDTTPNYDLDTVATYVCHSGFVLDLSLGGSEMRTCVDGIWNNLEPSCINAPSVICFAAVDSSCGGRFLGGTDSQSCCLPPEAQGLGGGGYLVNGFGDCISCTVGLVVTFDPPVYMVEEGGVVNLRVVVSGEADVSLSVQFTTEEDSASNDDFVPMQTTLTLNPGITVLMVAVETVGDELDEGDEILIGRLTSEHPLVTLGVSQATVIILDDDAVCSEVPSPDNGLVSYDTSDFPLPLDTVVTYFCNLGYALNGSANRTCMFVNDSATFEPEPPLCDPVCDDLPAVANGFIAYSEVSLAPYNVGSVATYSCLQDYELRLGDETRTCVDIGFGGIFIGVTPTCENTPPPVCPTSTYLDGSDCSVQCPPGAIGNHRSGLCEALPTEFEILTNATAYFVNMATTTQLNSVVLNYTVFLNQSGINAPIISLSLQSPLYSQEILTFDNGEQSKSYIPPFLPEGYSVDDNDIATFKESILYRGEVPQAFYSEGQASLQLDLTSVVSPSEILLGETATTPMFVTIMQQEQEITCDDLPALDNAVISYSSAISPRPIDTVATYQCVDEYTLEGSVTRTCGEDGMFDGEEPRCVLIPVCVELEPLVNGDIDYGGRNAPFSVGTVATYFCNTGYALVDGPDSKTCVESEEGTAVFNPPQTPICDLACDAISVPPNSIVTYNTEPVPPFPAGALAMFECVDGFSPVTTSPGEPTTFPLPGELILLECGEIIQGGGGVFVRNGTSSQVELNCIRDCVELPAITNGMISYSPDMTADYSAGTVATYTCDNGFELVPGVGNSMRTCLPQMSGDAEFDGAEPRCESQQSQCPPLPDITNGFVTYAPDTTPNYDLDTVATYVCHSGFVLDLSLGGSEMRTCVDGIWNNLEPSCINAPSVLCFAAVNSSCGGRFLGGNDSQSCCLPPEAQGLGGGGYLVNGFGDCISCTVGLVVTFDPPVYMVEEGGVVNLRVVVSGEADVSLSVQFTTEEDSASNDDFVPMQTTLTLNPGITVLMVAVETVGDELDEGDEILIGRLTSEHPLVTLGVSQATVIILDDDAVCSEVPSPDNGLVSYDTSDFPLPLDTVVTYFCNLGYALNGSANRTCMFVNDSATFEPEPPLCDPVCDDLPAVANGFIAYSEVSLAPYNVGSVATYSCLQDYELRLGDETRTCVDIGFGGIFIGVAPTCENTPPPVCPTSTYLDGSDCSVQCPPGAIGNHRSGLCEALPTEFEILTNATAYFVNMATTTQLNSVVLNYSVFLNQSGISSPIISLSLQSPLYSQEILTFDNGEQSKSYIPPFLPEGYSVDDNDIATFKESILYRGEVPQAFYSEGQASLQLDLTSLVSPSEILVGETATTPMFVTIMQQEQEITCDDLPALANAVISYSSAISPRPIDTVATYQCVGGYTLEGSVTRTCGEDGMFDGEEPRCVLIRIEIMFSMAIFSFAENVVGGQGFVDIVSNIPATQSFTFNVNGGPSTQNFVVASAAGLPGQVTFPAGLTSVRVPFTINNDEVGLEDLESYLASLSLTPEAIAAGVSLGAISQASVQVVDDDEVRLSVGQTTYSAQESDGSVTLSYVLNREAVRDVSFDVINTDGTATGGGIDYDSAGYSLNIPAGQTSVSRIVSITMDGVAGETPPETFSNSISSINTVSVVAGPTEATVQILDLDAPVTVSFGEIEYNFVENEVTGTIRVVTSRPSPVDFSFTVTAPLSDTQFIAPSGGSIDVTATFPAGTSSFDITFPINDDNVALEVVEELIATLSLNNAPTGVELGTPSVTVIRIQDDDGFSVGFVDDQVSVSESEGSVTLNIVSTPAARPVEITVITQDIIGGVRPATADADYNITMADITIPAFTTSTDFTVGIITDNVIEGDEVFRAVIVGAAADEEPLPISQPQSEVTIVDDDVVSVSFTMATFSFDEGSGTGSVTIVKNGVTNFPFDVRVTGGPSTQTGITVNAGGIDSIVTFPADQQMITINFPIGDDDLGLEVLERYIANLEIIGSTSGVVPGTITSAEVQVRDNDEVSVGFNVDSVTVEESDGTFRMCVSLNRPAAENIIVSLATQDGFAIDGQDYTSSSIPSELLIAAGETEACFTGDIIEDGRPGEGTESFTIVITGVDQSGVTFSRETTQVIIQDSDAQCPPLPEIANGMISYLPDNTPDYDVGTTANYICEDGFTLSGDVTRDCQSDGTFSGMEPVCSMTPVCAELPAITNGEIAYSSADMPRPIGTVASYTCNDGFNLDGPLSRTCVENAGSGMFDMTAPTCIPIECEELESLANGVITYGPDTVAPYSLNTNANHVCNRGYRLVGTQVRMCEDIGATDGQFNQEAPICEQITCDDLPALDNAVISYSSAISPRPIDTVATYQCVDGYTLEGSVTRTCGEDGMFDEEEPRCVVLIPVCVELELLVNGGVDYGGRNDPFSVGTVATYFCNTGYALNGPDSKTCVESDEGTGVFDPPQTPICDPICDAISIPPNSRVTYNTFPLPPFPAGALAMFECDHGFSPVTTSPGEPDTFPLPGELILLECGEIMEGAGGVFVRNGTSSQVELDCTPVCDELAIIANGMIVYTGDMTAPYDIGTLATYSCNPGFVLSGENVQRTCMNAGDGIGGRFDGVAPTSCIRTTIECLLLPALANGVITYMEDVTPNFELTTMAVHECVEGFRRLGPRIRTCVAPTNPTNPIGVWDLSRPNCVPLCPALPDITNGAIVYSTDTLAPYDIGTVATYSCNEGYVLTGGNVERICVDSGDGNDDRFNGEAPSCPLLVLPPGAVAVEMESARVTVSEGQNVVGVVIVKDPTPRDLLVTVILASITATGGVDYGPFSNPIVRLPALLPANDTRVTFFIPLMDDNIVESTETFRVGLESRDSSVIVVGIDSTLVFIEDDDVVEFTLSLRDRSPIISEGNVQLTFNLTKEGEATRNVYIVVRTQDDSTTGGGDYTILELPLTFAPSESLMEFTVDVRDDSIVETMETFTVTFEPAVGETGVAPITTETVITIVDDNDFVSVGFVPPSSRLVEGATGLVQLQSSGNNEIPVTVAIDVANFGTATVGLDFYLNVSNISFEPGVTSLFIPVVAVSDGLYEGEDESVILIGRPGDGETRVRVIPGSEQATFILTDTDSVSVGFLMSVMTVSESSGPVDVAIGLVNGRLATDVVLRVDATGDLAEMDDFDFQSVELTFGPGQPNVSIVTIGIRDDSVFEGREGFSLSLTSDSPRVDFDPQILQVLIVDNEDLIVLFSSTVYTAQETDPSVEVRVQLGPGIQLQRDITLDLRTSDGVPPTGATSGLDFEPVNTTLTFGPGVTTANRTIMLLDDEISEGLENFEVQVVLVNEELGDPGVIVSARVLVFDNEDIFVSLSSMEYIVEEGRGLVVIAIDKSGITPGNQDTLVLLTLSDGTAIGGTVDYGPFPVATPTTLPALLLANDTRTLFGIPITNDNLVEGDESFFVALSIANELSRENGGIVFLGNLTMATVVITDNDVINVLLVVSGQEMGVVTVEEGGVAISLSAVRNDNVRLARNVTMVARTTAGTAQGFTDFLPATITLEFLAGVQMMDFSMFLLEDTVAEGNESFTVTLDSSDPGVVISSGTVEIIIVDNDVALVNFAQEIYDAFELDRSVEVCLTKSADTAIPVIISLVPMETANPPDDAVPALATIDFDATPINVTFAPTATQACVRVSVFQDNLRGEGLEVFSLTLAGLEGQAAIIGRGDRSIVNVLLNDVPDVIVGIATLSPVAVVEGAGRVEVCVTVFNPAPSEPLNTTLTVTIETISGTADDTDYTPVTAVLVLDNGLRSDCFQVRILDDDLFEDPVLEEFNLNILSVESTNLDFRVLTSPANVTVVIGDDDRSVTIGFSDVFYSVNESDSVRVCVAVTIPPPMERFTQQEIVLLVSTLPGTANESDYMSFSDRVVGTVSNNNRETCFVVEVINDEIIEQSEETFSLVLSVEVPMDSDLSVSLDPSVAIVIITDDDEPPPPPTPTITTPTPTLGTTPTPTVTLGTTPTPTVIVGTTPTPTPIPTTTPTPVVRGNDTIVGDPLFSVPLNLVDGSELLELKTLLHLCYEIHGRPDTYFNLVSDECTNINAYYTGVVPDTTDSLGLNIITQIGVRAIDSQGNCVRVRIDSASNCTPVVMTSGGGVVSEIRYDRDGVIVSKVRNRVRVSVPNCGGNRLVMWVTCEAPGGMMRFDITRGVGLTPTSHGLLGQFWNVPVTIRKYTYTGGEELYLDVDQLYVVTVTHPNTGSTRRFIAEFGRQIWDLSNKDCLYAGNIQGGRLGDIDDASVSDSVVEGRYSQYVVDGLFDHDFDYFHFNADSCI